MYMISDIHICLYIIYTVLGLVSLGVYVSDVQSSAKQPNTMQGSEGW